MSKGSIQMGPFIFDVWDFLTILLGLLKKKKKKTPYSEVLCIGPGISMVF